MSDRPAGGTSPSETLSQVGQDARAAADAVRDGAGEVAGEVRNRVGEALGDAKAQGEEVVGAVRERAGSVVEDGVAAGAERAQGFARAIHHAADDLEGSSPEVARHVRTAAGAIEGIAANLRDRSAGELLSELTDFARRQPTAFFGVAAIAGFALARFAKSSASHGGLGHRTSGQGHGSTGAHGPSGLRPDAAPGWAPTEDGAPARPMTMAAASLGGKVAHRAGDAAPGSMPGPDVAEPRHDPARPHASGGSPAHGGASPMPNERTGSAL